MISNPYLEFNVSKIYDIFFTNYFQASRSGAYEEEIKPSKLKEVVLLHDKTQTHVCFRLVLSASKLVIFSLI
jgi:hypothetical protein